MSRLRVIRRNIINQKMLGVLFMKSRTYPNGFIFTDIDMSDVELPEYYEAQKIGRDFTYFFDSHTNKVVYTSQDKFIIIHGLFTHIDLNEGDLTSSSPRILLELFFNDKEKFLDTLNFLGGRFVIIIGESDKFEVYPDASAMRTAFFHNDAKFICSHIKMMDEVFVTITDPIYTINEDVIKLWDTTQYSEVKSINPNFYYSSSLNKTNRFFPRKINKYIDRSYEDKLEIFEFLWKEQLKYFREQYETIIFSITGGADSRVSLALAKEYMDSMSFFTYAPTIHVDKYNARFFKSLSKDKKIVDQILEVIPLNHQYLLFKDNNRKLTENETEVLNKNTNLTHGRFLLPHYNHYFSQEKVLHIRGNLFEIGRAFFIKKYTRNHKNEIIKLVSSSLFKEIENKNETKILEEYLNDNIEKFNYHNNNYEYHLLDLYYWEIRMGRWMAEVLNETDLSFETLLPFNMRELMDISLSFKVQERKSNYMFDELINRNFPVLNFFGKNDTKNIYEMYRKPLFKKLFNKITIYNSSNEVITQRNNANNEIFLPKEFLDKKHFSEVTFNYKRLSGNASLVLQGEYKNDRAKDYLKYQVLVNNVIKLEEDIALWNLKTNIMITGLNKNDVVHLRVISVRKSSSESWEKASKIKILSYDELAFKGELSLKVYTNSPFGIV